MEAHSKLQNFKSRGKKIVAVGRNYKYIQHVFGYFYFVHLNSYFELRILFLKVYWACTSSKILGFKYVC